MRNHWTACPSSATCAPLLRLDRFAGATEALSATGGATGGGGVRGISAKTTSPPAMKARTSIPKAGAARLPSPEDAPVRIVAIVAPASRETGNGADRPEIPYSGFDWVVPRRDEYRQNCCQPPPLRSKRRRAYPTYCSSGSRRGQGR